MTPIKLEIELTKEQADAYCKFCSRSYFDIFQQLARNEDEAYLMRDALYSIWHRLTDSDA